MYSNRFLRILCSASLALLSALPAHAAGTLSITEIMYDLPGANAGRQWVEVMNVGDASIDMADPDLRFFDKTGAHRIAGFSGGTELMPGALAIVADKPEAFLADHPGFSGMLLDSVVSLTASGIVGFKTASGTVLDTAAYASTQGAKGDGNSLHRAGTGFVSGPPNPGISGIPAAASKPAGSGESSTKSQGAISGTNSRSSTAYDAGIVAPDAAENPAAAGAVLPAAARPSFIDTLSSPWFAGFLALLVFSSASLILIRTRYA